MLAILRFLLRVIPGRKIEGPEDVVEECNDLIVEEQERFVVLALNNKMKVLWRTNALRGTAYACLCHPREVFKDAIRAGAWGIIVVHNHPSSDYQPSEEDLQVFAILTQSGGLLRIPVIDCIIIAGQTGEYWSRREYENLHDIPCQTDRNSGSNA